MHYYYCTSYSTTAVYYALPLIGGALSDDAVWRRTSVCRVYTGPKSRTERPRKTKIGTEVAHVTRDSDTTFKFKRSRSPGRFTHRGINASGSCSGSVGPYWPWEPTATCVLHSAGAVGSAARGASAPTEGGEGRGHIVAAARLQLVIACLC